MRRSRRRGSVVLVCAGAVLLIIAILPSLAFAHAELTRSDPPADARLATPPTTVSITFSEPIQLLRADDADVVDEDGVVVSGPATVSSGDARVLTMPIPEVLEEGTYTVRYSIIGADSHVIPGVYVFGVGRGELAPPYSSAEVSRGPSEAGAWGVSSRFLQLVALGGLIGLIAYRMLVWAPAVRGRADTADEEGAAVLSWGRDSHWMAFGVLALAAMAAEAYLLVVQSARVLGVGTLSALRDTTGLSQVLADTEFGSLAQLRGALLFAVFAAGAVVFAREYGMSGAPRPPRASERPLVAVLLSALLLIVLAGVAAQGHPRVAAVPAVQIAAQFVHVVAVAVWMAGLALTAVALLRLPRVAPESGPLISALLLARFSRVAVIAVGVAVATGVVRSITELGAPEELWETAYGRSIVAKLLLLCPIVALALYNRRVLVALRTVERPTAATLRLVRRSVSAELVVSLAIVAIASLLVAQVPGG